MTRLGIIGMGYAGAQLLQAAESVADLTVSAATDQNPERLQDLPDSAEIPIVYKLTTDIIPAIFVVLGGKMTEEQLMLHAETLEDRLERIPDVGKVELFGHRDREVHIELDTQRLGDLWEMVLLQSRQMILDYLARQLRVARQDFQL